MFYEANIFGSIWDVVGGFITAKSLAVIIPLAIGFAINRIWKYIKPVIDTIAKKEMALWIAQIADDLTDQLVLKYPSDWTQKLDEAVDKLKDKIDNYEVAERAVHAAAGRRIETE